MLIIYMYAILGMAVLGTTMTNGFMNDYVNFDNFIHAFLTLFILATGDSWNNI